MKRIKNSTDISPKVRNEVILRDGCCIVCGSYRNLQVAHFIGRSQLGLGIPKNLGLMCVECHTRYDNGDARKEIGNLFENYLRNHYQDWNREELVYKKYQNLK